MFPLTFGFLAIFLLSGANGNMNGAPIASCATMKVNHPKTRPTANPGPFSIKLSKDSLTNSETVDVSMMGDSTLDQGNGLYSGLFSGFLLMAFNANAEASGPIGSFAEMNTGKSKYLPCFDKPQISVTHPNSNLRQNVTVKWVPPSGFVGQVIFRGTFTQTFNTYYEKIPSTTISITDSGVPTEETPASSTITSTTTAKPTSTPTNTTTATNTTKSTTTVEPVTDGAAYLTLTPGWFIFAVILWVLPRF